MNNEDFKEGRPMMRLQLGSAVFVLPFDAGIQVLGLMRDATPVDLQYTPDYSQSWWVPLKGRTEISGWIFPVAYQAKLLMGGGDE